MTLETEQLLRLDLNNPVFQLQLFNLSKSNQRNILNTLRKLGSPRKIPTPELSMPFVTPDHL